MLGSSGVEDFIFSMAFGTRGIIKSVQRGTTLLSDLSTVTSINPVSDKHLLLINVLPQDSNDAFAEETFVRGYVYNGDSISFLRSGQSCSVTVSWQLIEFTNIKSVQQGTAGLLGQTTLDIIVNGVDMTKSILMVNWEVNSANHPFRLAFVKYTLVDANTIRLERLSTVDVAFRWFLIEF
jgi:hypothetical protein